MSGEWVTEGNISRRDSEELRHEMHLEQIYGAFKCPLTKEIMRDPVSIETGHTFEREAIEDWFRECRRRGEKPTCPVTSKELQSVELSPSIGLKSAIAEWTERNEVTKIEMARRFLLGGGSEADVLQSLENVQFLCKQRSRRRVVLSAGLIPMIADTLKNASSRVRLKSLETLRIVAEGDDESKEAIGAGDTVRTIVKFLSQDHSQAKKEAIFLLCELSKSEILSERIGDVAGAVLILVGMANNKSENFRVVQAAEKTLENMETCEKNVLQMAEYSRLQPLLRLLLKGSPETRLAMAAHLGDLALNPEAKIQVAEMAGSSLIEFLRSGSKPAREAALKALNQISSHPPSAKILVDHDLLPPLISALFIVGPHQLPARLKELAASILSSLVLSGPDLSSIPLNPQRETLISETVIHNLLHLINNTGPAIETKLLQVLVGLTSSSSTSDAVVATVKSSGAAMSLIQFALAPQPDLRLVAIKLLHNLSPFMAPELGSAFLSSSSQISDLVRIITVDAAATEEQAEAAGLLAELPYDNLPLTERLLALDAFSAIFSILRNIQFGISRSSKFSDAYLEGLVRLLARVTFLLPNTGAIQFSRHHGLCEVFIDMLKKNGMEKVQVAAAKALEQLSKQTKILTREIHHSQDSLSYLCGSLFSCLSSQQAVSGFCPVHRGVCSMNESFCLVEGRAVERLVPCLEQGSELVAVAAMAALCTLLEDGLDIEATVQVLMAEGAIDPVFQGLEKWTSEGLRHNAVWAVERILRNEDIARKVSADQRISSAIVEAFRVGDNRTKQLAERALEHIDRLPKFSSIYPNRM